MPTAGSEFPPRELQLPFSDIGRWGAWWSGNPELLAQAYGAYTGNTTVQSWAEQGHGWAQRGGLAGAWSRFFWGQRNPTGQQLTKLHMPVAAEIAQVSADLLFGQPPQILLADTDSKAPGFADTQDRIDELMGETAHTVLHEAAEACAALGGTFLRVGWDLDVDPDCPLLTSVDADAAIPVYRYGRLVEVTFVREFSETNGTVLRHLEHHERGIVWHAAYLGDTRNLGRPVPLTEHPDTANLISDAMVSDDTRAGSGIPTGIDRLAVVGIPNARSIGWRHLPAARDMGRADIAGVEQDLDALDDVWSSWMRDVRHGRSRIHVPQHMLETRGPGKGAIADVDREVYVGLESPPDGALQLTTTQFAIRYQEHAATAAALMERITAGAGYSPQTFGLDDTNALTATESWNRQTRTQNTRNAKIRRWRPALVELTRIMLDIDRAHFGGKANPDLVPEVHFPETVSESQLTKAQTANLLRTAKAASTETLVKMMHGDWDDEQVQDEVARINDEEPAAPDPMNLFGHDPADDQPQDDNVDDTEPPEQGDQPDDEQPEPQAA